MSSPSTSVSNNLVSSGSFHFHNFDPKANEEKKRLNREMIAKNTHNGMAFKPSKYMVDIQHSNNNQRQVSPASPVSYRTSRSNSSSNKSAAKTISNSHSSISKQHKLLSNNHQYSKSRICEKQLTINASEWNSIKQSIESRSRNVSNCSNSSTLSKSSCYIDKNSVNGDYSKGFVNCPSNRNYSSNYQVYSPLAHYSEYSQNISLSNTSNLPSQLSISKTIPLTSSISPNNVPFTRSMATHCERLPSIQHLLETIPITKFERRNNSQLNTVSIIELLKQ
ncbi:predicted protein [Naegleria gruberi]|uniref:Predicted protein n=1 Tax=Naegleria gruberi TaxID=5762 RepID=D2VNJ7_NAEGR|nr:uncharacterized protein NAEGRDRAFT_70525 [Naegleria gruberi]EFC41670.1 predicted protein [Naegleria gruberi]|eukprot:XP_002674414.1 predicted protein [Naegleria gruberi strain NEG-M]